MQYQADWVAIISSTRNIITCYIVLLYHKILRMSIKKQKIQIKYNKRIDSIYLSSTNSAPELTAVSQQILVHSKKLSLHHHYHPGLPGRTRGSFQKRDFRFVRCLVREHLEKLSKDLLLRLLVKVAGQWWPLKCSKVCERWNVFWQ